MYKRPLSALSELQDEIVYLDEITGEKRTGCFSCTMGVQMEKGENRFQRMKKTHPKQYDYCMKPIEDGGLGLDEVLSFMKIHH